MRASPSVTTTSSSRPSSSASSAISRPPRPAANPASRPSPPSARVARSTFAPLPPAWVRSARQRVVPPGRTRSAASILSTARLGQMTKVMTLRGRGLSVGARAGERSRSGRQRLRCTYPLPPAILTLVSSAAEKLLNRWRMLSASEPVARFGTRTRRRPRGRAARRCRPRDLGAHEDRLGGLAAEPAEHEVAEAVEDESAVIGLDAVEQVRVVGEDDVGAGVDGGVALALLQIARCALVLEVPVPADDDVVGLLPGRLDRRLDGADVGAARRRAGACRRRWIARRQHVGETEKGDLGAVLGLSTDPPGPA